jgi:peptidoglycan/LPS O-acetylase OafA/YrhL
MLVSGFYILVQQKMPENTLQWLGNKAQQYSYWLWGAGIVVLSIMMVWNCNQRFRAIPFFNALYDAFNWISELWLSVGFGLCILALLFGPPQLRRFFEWGPVRWIGLISYGLYMWHLPLLIQFNEYLKPYDHNFPGWLTYGLYWACVLLIIIPFSFAFYLCIERPGIKLSDRLLNRRAHNKDQRPITSNFSEAVPGRRGI